MARVLLVYPNVARELIGYGDLGAIAEPLALEYVGGAARTDGHEVRILDLRLHQDDLDDTLRTYDPEIVGVTGYSMHVLRMLAILRRVKELLPGVRTVVGGHHATLLPEDFFELEVDFVIGGEGVFPFRRLLRALDDERPTGEIPGVWARQDGLFVSGGPPEKFTIDDLPPPDRSLVEADRDSYFIDWMRPIALLRTTVGCPYRCNFCSLWKIMDGRYHTREITRVVDELESVRESSVFLVDDEAFVNGKRMGELADAIAERGIEKRFFAYCRIDTLLRQPDLMRKWREIGLERLFIGIEAPSDSGLLEYNKRIQVSQVEEGLRAAKGLGIEVFAGFVVNTNYTAADFKYLFRFIEHNKISYPSFTVLTPLPGTSGLTTFDPVTERQPNGRPNWALFDLQHVVTKTRLPRAEFERHYKDMYRVFGEKYTVHRKYVRLRDKEGGIVAGSKVIIA